MGDTRLSAALIGCGRIGSTFVSPSGSVLTHAGAYAASAQTILVGVCDADPEAAAESSRRWGVPGYRRVEQLLEETRPAMVSICTPDSTHAKVVEQVVAAPSVRALLVEKPLADSVAEAERVTALARERGVVLGVNYSRRWAPGVRAAAEAIRGGRFGTVRTVSGHYANGWLHNGTHWIDLARMITGEVVAARALRSRPTATPGDEALDVELAFEGGATGVVLGHVGDGLSLFEMDVVCSAGRVCLSEGAQTIESYDLVPSPTYSGFFHFERTSCTTGGLDRCILNAVEDVASCVRDGGRLPACAGADGVAALRAADLARQP